MLHKRTFWLVALATVALFVLSATSALAIMEKALNLEELAAEAAQIVLGRVTSVTSYWNADKTEIHTTVKVSVETYMKGRGGKEIAFEIPGGEVGDIGLWVEDVPVFAEGEEVILFLQEGEFPLVGWQQGKLTVAEGMVLGEEVVPLYEFMAQVHAILKAQGGLTVAEKGSEVEGFTVEYVTAVLDPSLPKIELKPDAGKVAGEVGLDTWLTIKWEDFEGAFPGSWTIYGTPSWDDMTYRKYAGSWAGWCADTTMTAPGPYAPNMNAWMVYGPFSLVGASDAEVRFYHWLDSEQNRDWFQVLTSIDGTHFGGHQISGRIRSWNFWNYDMSSRCGQANVWVAFRFVSDGSVQYEGAYLDNILITKDDRRPNITSVSPTGVAAGVNWILTINGWGFGSTQGASSVQFWHEGATWTTAPIVSWGDTLIQCRVPAPASSHATQAVRVNRPGYGSAYKGLNIYWAWMGVKWPGTCQCITYYVYENTSDCTGEGFAVRRGAWQWNNAEYHCHLLSYRGSSTRSAPVYDGYNVIRWGSRPSGILATCWTWYSGSTIVEFDIVFNDAYIWSTATPVPAGQYDVWGIASHELGHGGVGLCDLYGLPDSAKTMYGYSSAADMGKRDLTTFDAWAIQYLY